MTSWQRDKFEQWCKQQRPPMTLDRDSTGYIEYATYHAWAGWRAAMTIRNRSKKRRHEK